MTPERPGRLRALVARRAGRARWGYVPALAALAFLTWRGLHEGVLAVLCLATLAAVCTLQLFRPTLLGWALLLVMFVLSTISILYLATFYASRGVPIDRGQYILFLGCGAVPSATLFLARPRTRGDERGAVLLALTLATLMIAPLFAPIL